MISDTFSDGYDAARRRTVWSAREDQARIVVSGRDRASYLQGLLTNDIAALAEGRGCYSAYLTPQGRMITDLAVYELGDVILLTLPEQTHQTVLAKLDQFIFSEDVQLGDVTDAFACVSVIGPESPRAVAQAIGFSPETIAALPEYGCVRAAFAGAPCIVLRIADRGETAFDVLIDRAQRQALLEKLEALGVAAVDAAVLEAIRIEEGIPRFGVDMGEDTIPLEAGIETRAISFGKGCYVGQEVIIRVLHRGHGRVAKKLVGLAIEHGDPPAAGAEIHADGKRIGAVTSAAWSPRMQQAVALGYVHRDAAAPGTRVRIGERDAVVAALPFSA